MLERIIDKLQVNDGPDASGICEFAQKGVRLFLSYAFDEPYSACFYDRILTILNPFISLTETFKIDMLQELLHRLNSFLTCQSSGSDECSAYSDDIEQLESVIDQYNDQMHRYYEEFSIILEHESAGTGRVSVRVTSMVEQYLLRLLALMEQAMLNAEGLIGLLNEWRQRLANSEFQELYN